MDYSLDELWNKYFLSGDEDTKEALIIHYLPMVKFIANKIAISLPPHVDVADLISPGIIGLIKAIEKYNPVSGAKFETYASTCVSGAIVDELRALDWVPRSVRKKSKIIQDAFMVLEEKLGKIPSDEEVANYLELTLEEYDQLLLQSSPATMISLYTTASDNDAGDKSVSIIDRLAGNGEDTPVVSSEANELKGILADAIEALPDQERIVVTLYYYEDMVLKEIGKTLGITESRVSQIHSKAILRLRGRVKKTIAK